MKIYRLALEPRRVLSGALPYQSEMRARLVSADFEENKREAKQQDGHLRE
jgi:hypothetical protein